MKRIIALLLCLIMAVCAVACNSGNTPAETTKAPETQAPETTAEVVETEPATEAPVATDAPTTDAPITEAPPAEKQGCGSMISGAVALIALLGTAIVFKKKD